MPTGSATEPRRDSMSSDPRRDSMPSEPRRDSMSLLSDLAAHALDEEYAERAAARSAAGEPPWRPSRSPFLLLALLLVGLTLTAAAVVQHQRSRAGATDEVVDEVEQRVAAADALRVLVDRLRASVDDAQRQRLRLTEQGAALQQRLRDLGVVTGTAAVTGPGVKLVVDDARSVGGDDGRGGPAPGAGGGDRTGSDAGEQGRVLDRDLQVVVNALWGAGAEAVSVNGQRLTALAAIRAAGQAILVDYRPLSPPYTVLAVGDPKALQVQFTDGTGGRYLQVLEDNYGVRWSLTTSDRLRLPAASGVRLRSATVRGGS